MAMLQDFDWDDTRARSGFVRLRTLILLRWVAIAGQVAAINIARWAYDLQLELTLCYAAIGVSVLGNLLAIWAYPENKRLSHFETLAWLGFDVLQLCFLLSLTGGLNNPFALLVLAPVTISATLAPIRYTAMLGTLAFVVITLTGLYHIPLRTSEGFILRLPDLFAFGFWVAIIIGGLFITVYTRRVTQEIESMSQALQATQMALAREQKLTDLGGVVAAAAHELGTPLATIKLVSSELLDDLTDPDHKDDARLIAEQANRCRDILQSMGRAGKDDLHLRYAPLETVIQEAAEPHMDRGTRIDIGLNALNGGPQPQIRRHPEIIHGLRNLVQNAVDFSESAVSIAALWDSETISIQITDDGRGFSAAVIGRLGDPFMRRRPSNRESVTRPGYSGMGLGLFIAKTLLERTGANLAFSNDSSKEGLRGAQVVVTWDCKTIVQKTDEALGENRLIDAET